MNRTIIIPAGGKAVRLNGILKELLPIDNDGNTGLSNALDIAKSIGSKRVIVLTSAAKWYLHNEYIRMYQQTHKLGRMYIELVLQHDYTYDMWSALLQGLSMSEQYTAGGLLMPDTITKFDPQYGIRDYDNIAFGVFATQEPHRFSIIQESRIQTKPEIKNVDGYWYPAWGIVFWSAWAHRIMMNNARAITHYDQAFQTVINETVNYDTFHLDYYYDIGTLDSYIDYRADKDLGAI